MKFVSLPRPEAPKNGDHRTGGPEANGNQGFRVAVPQAKLMAIDMPVLIFLIIQ